MGGLGRLWGLPGGELTSGGEPLLEPCPSDDRGVLLLGFRWKAVTSAVMVEPLLSVPSEDLVLVGRAHQRDERKNQLCESFEFSVD